MIRLFAGLLVAGSFFVVAAQQEIKKPADHAPATVQGISGVSVSSAVVDFSELAAEEAASGSKPAARLHHRPKGWPFGPRGVSDKAPPQIAQALAPAPLVSSPPLATNFLGTLDNGFGVPPDTMGAVGPRHIMVTVNTEVKILTRGGQPLSSVRLDQFWSRVGPNGTSDPHSFFDADSGRWFIVTISDFESPTASILLGASQTDDPLGRWNLYKIDADAADVEWPDYPTMGMNSKWVVIGGNNFSNSSGAFTGAGVWVFDKQSLTSGALTIPFKSFPVRSGFTLQPCITLDQTEQTLYLVENFGIDSLRISTVTGPANNPSVNVGVAFAKSRLGGWNLQGGDLGFQLGDARGIDAGDPRLMNAYFRNGSIWCSHSVFFPATGAPTHAAAQWWQINPSGSVIQQGRIEDTSGNSSYSYPSIGVNKNNDVLLGYTKFNTTGYASAMYSFRAGTDPLNTLQDSALLKAGEGSYFKDFGSGRNRWGDYSMTLVDPLNDLDLWTIQEYAAAPIGGISQWGVWWGMVLRSTPPDGILDVQVSPATLSDVAIGAATDFFVTVSDSFELVTNATVVASIPGRQSVTFRNDGVFPDVVAADNVYSATITLNSPSESPLVFTATAPGKQPGSITATYNIIPRPPNDNFADAIKIPAGGIFGLESAQIQNNFATTEANEPLHAGVSNFRSLWWTYSTGTAAPVLVDTSGSGPRVVIGVYTGTSLVNLFPVASTNPPVGKPAILKFNAQPGVTYRIAVSGADQGEKGLVRLRVQPNGEPDINPPLVTVDFPPSGMVTNSQAILFSGTAIDPAPQASGVRSVLIEDVQTEPANVVQATLNGTQWTANITLSEATNVFRVHGVDFADNASAPKTIVVYYRPTSNTTNDLFGFSRPLTSPSGVDFATSTNATREFNEPLHGGNEGGASVWWTYTPTQNGVLSLNTFGSDFDTLLGVYTVNDPLDHNLADLIPIAQNDDSTDAGDGTSEIPGVAVEAGRTYYIAVDGYGGDKGNVRLEYNFSPAGVFTVTTSTTGGGSVSPTGGTFPADSAVTVTAIPDRYRQFSRFFVTQNGITTVFTNGPSVTFALSGNTQVAAEFVAKQFADDFQSGGFNKLPYQISSSPAVGQHWVVAQVETNSVTHEGSLVARVRDNLPDATSASLVVVTNLTPGTGSFEFSVNTETNYDRFEFSVDGRVVGSWSGFVPWQTFFFDVPVKSTPTRLEWRYSKDLAITVNNELVAIDNLDLPIARPLPPPPITVSIAATTTGVAITAVGPADTDFRLESTSDFTNWTTAPDGEQNSGPTGIVTFNQPTTGAARYYRVVRL